MHNNGIFQGFTENNVSICILLVYHHFLYILKHVPIIHPQFPFLELCPFWSAGIIMWVENSSSIVAFLLKFRLYIYMCVDDVYDLWMFDVCWCLGLESPLALDDPLAIIWFHVQGIFQSTTSFFHATINPKWLAKHRWYMSTIPSWILGTMFTTLSSSFSSFTFSRRFRMTSKRHGNCTVAVVRTRPKQAQRDEFGLRSKRRKWGGKVPVAPPCAS